MDNGLRRMLSYTRRAIDDYDMIDEGEVIAVGVSGGKDSLALLVTMAHLAKFHPKHFFVVGIAVDMGWEGTDYSEIQRLCDGLGIPLYIEPSEITHIVFDVRKEKIRARSVPSSAAERSIPPPSSTASKKSRSAITLTTSSRHLCSICSMRVGSARSSR